MNARWRRRAVLLSSAVAALGCFGIAPGSLQAAAAGLPTAGDLYFTTYCGAARPDNVNKVQFTYDGTAISYGSKTNIVQAQGADGIIFAPDGDLLVGGQTPGLVHKINTVSKTIVEANSNIGAAFHVALDPSGTSVFTMGLPGNASQIPLAGFGAPSGGVPRYPSGDDNAIVSIAFDSTGQGFYTSSGPGGNGNFGRIDLATFHTTRIYPNLPAAHGMVFDSFTGNLILFGASHLTQIAPSTGAIVSDGLFSAGQPFDQGSVDGRGHAFAASNDGTLLFVDYSASRLIASPTNFNSAQFLTSCLDDLAPLSGLGSVRDQPISATGAPFSAAEGTDHCATVATFTDPDAGALAADYTATVQWGDGSSSAGTVAKNSSGQFVVSGCHIYSDEGSFVITVTISDADTAANAATVTSSATVADAALSSTAACASNSSQVYAGPTAGFLDASSTGTPGDFTATVNWGDGTQSTGTIAGGPGNAPYTVSAAHTYSSTGFFAITTTVTDSGGATTSATCANLLVFAPAPGGGSFVIGDLESAPGSNVTFWGAKWWKANPTSTGSRVPSFKGFAESPSEPACGASWSADPGNSTPPPPGPLPAYMAVIVTDSYSKSGPVISGDAVHIVIVKTNPGYQPNPGHPGTGTVVEQVC